MAVSIINDDRKIKAIYWADEATMSVGKGGIEKIEPYYENGQLASVVWLAIYRNGKIDQRVNIAHIDTINY